MHALPPARRPKILKPAEKEEHIAAHVTVDADFPGCEVWTGAVGGDDPKLYPVLGAGRQPGERVRRFLAEQHFGGKAALVGYRVGWNERCHPMCVRIAEDHIWPTLAPGYSA